MTELAAILACVVLAGLAVFQTLLIAGRPYGNFAWGGQHRVIPRRLRIGSVVSIALYAFIAVILLDKAGLIGILPNKMSNDSAWFLVAYFSLGTFMNALSRSKPERNTMTPVALTLAVLSLIVALE